MTRFNRKMALNRMHGQVGIGASGRHGTTLVEMTLVLALVATVLVTVGKLYHFIIVQQAQKMTDAQSRWSHQQFRDQFVGDVNRASRLIVQSAEPALADGTDRRSTQTIRLVDREGEPIVTYVFDTLEGVTRYKGTVDGDQGMLRWKGWPAGWPAGRWECVGAVTDDRLAVADSTAKGDVQSPGAGLVRIRYVASTEGPSAARPADVCARLGLFDHGARP
jgi:hypothetical protein